MMKSSKASAAPFAFIGLVMALSALFWMLGAGPYAQLMPGLPVSALMAVTPAMAALVLRAREAGLGGAISLASSVLDVRRVKSARWIAVSLLAMPAAAAIAYAIMVLMGREVPAPVFDPALALSLAAVFFIAAAAEEIGWTAYATDPLIARYGPLAASLFLGALWAIQHVIPLIQAGRSFTWIAWWALGTIAIRVVMVWLYRGSGSVFAVTLFHMTQNVCWQLFPIRGSHYDPQISGLIFTAAALAVLAVARRTQPAGAQRS